MERKIESEHLVPEVRRKLLMHQENRESVCLISLRFSEDASIRTETNEQKIDLKGCRVGAAASQLSGFKFIYFFLMIVYLLWWFTGVDMM